MQSACRKVDWWNAPPLRAGWRPEEAWHTFVTSSVISVAMDLPISWYWGPLPEGPRRMKRNLEAEITINKHGGKLRSPINQSRQKSVSHVKYAACELDRHFYYVAALWPHTWWRWGPLPDHWEEPPATDGQRPPRACWGSPALPLRRCRPQRRLGSFSWSEDLSGSEALIVSNIPIMLSGSSRSKLLWLECILWQVSTSRIMSRLKSGYK